jgi:hypothetical protein
MEVDGVFLIFRAIVPASYAVSMGQRPVRATGGSYLVLARNPLPLIGYVLYLYCSYLYPEGLAP